MPFIYGRSGTGPRKCFIKWGRSGKEYHYTCGNEAARKRAKAKANAQRTAIFSTGWTGR